MLRAEFEARTVGKTQTEIAADCGVSKTVVNQVFTGRRKPYPKLVSGIAKSLGWKRDPTELFAEVEVS